LRIGSAVGGGDLGTSLCDGVAHRSFLFLGSCYFCLATPAFVDGLFVLRQVELGIVSVQLELVAAARTRGAGIYDIPVVAYSTENVSTVRKNVESIPEFSFSGSVVCSGRGRSTFCIVVGGGLLPSRSFARSSTSCLTSTVAALAIPAFLFSAASAFLADASWRSFFISSAVRLGRALAISPG
jgi:hypothetical protein